MLLGGVAACSDAEADPEPEDTPVVDTSVDADGDAAADGDEDELGGDDVEEYEHPVPGPDFDDEGQAGAEAAAVYFVELFHYISASGDFEAWDELTESDCDFCTVARSQVEELYVSGGYSIVEVPVVDGVSSQIWTGSPEGYVVEVVFESPGSKRFDSDGAITDEFAATQVVAWVLVSYEGESWLVRGVESEDVT